MKYLLLLSILWSFSCSLEAQTTGTTNLNAVISPEASIVINTGSTVLSSPTVFAAFAGTTAFTYKIRTSAIGGSGALQVQVTSDFSPSGGPSVSSPLNASDKLSYTCSVTSPATSCSGTQNASTSAQTAVATFGSDAHSGVSGNAGSVAWSLTNDAAYKTNTYSAVVTFTISAT